MESNYAETAVKRKVKFIDLLIRVMWIGILIYGSIWLFKLNGMLLLVYIGLHATLMHFFWGSYKVEYEYIYCDGQLDFDIIKNNKKRKHILRVQLDDAALFAYLDSAKLADYEGRTVNVDFTSKFHPEDVYALIVKKQDKMLKILFEPSDKMIEGIRWKLPKKHDIKEKNVTVDLEK